MSSSYRGIVAYVVCFCILFAFALTPLVNWLLTLGLSDIGASLLGLFTVILVPFVPAKLVSEM
jgi:hypothetical protein